MTGGAGKIHGREYIYTIVYSHANKAIEKREKINHMLKNVSEKWFRICIISL